jgi:hypothetical protein
MPTKQRPRRTLSGATTYLLLVLAISLLVTLMAGTFAAILDRDAMRAIVFMIVSIATTAFVVHFFDKYL